MEFELARNWWAVALRGVLAILFGVIAFFWPFALWLAVAFIFGAYALLDGSMALVLAVTGHAHAGRWWALLAEGLLGVTAGVLAFLWPLLTAVTVFYLIAGWAVATGVFEIVAAIRLRKYIRGEWLLALSGVLSIILGVVLAMLPGAGMVVLAWWTAANSIVFGALLLGLAFRLRSMVRHAPAPEHAMAR